MIILPIVLGIMLCKISFKLCFYWGSKGLSRYRSKMLFAISFWLMVMFGMVSYGVQRYNYPCTNADIFINGTEGITLKSVLVGMGGNIIFGFIDNAGLFFGGCYLDEVFELLPGANDANVIIYLIIINLIRYKQAMVIHLVIYWEHF